jgi:hypothetical protein
MDKKCSGRHREYKHSCINKSTPLRSTFVYRITNIDCKSIKYLEYIILGIVQNKP